MGAEDKEVASPGVDLHQLFAKDTGKSLRAESPHHFWHS
jgi:hypothetical protein